MRAFALALLLAATPAAALDVTRELSAAEDLSVRGQSGAAIDAYRRVLESGHDGADLRYNLGTLYLTSGDVGRAVLHLRAALRAQPRHEDARFNLEQAIAARADHVDAGGREPITSRVASFVSSSEAAWFFLGALALFFALVGAWPWTRNGARRAVKIGAIVAALLLADAAFLLWARVVVDGTQEAVVLADEIPARAGPQDDAATTFLAHAGLFGEVVAREGGYARVRLDNGLDAWLPVEALAFTRP
jgi:tetratricopeptide (TPR) repeat protein